MTLPPPKIDHRTYAELVANTEWLAQCFTGYGFLILKFPFLEPSPTLSFEFDLRTFDSLDQLPSEGTSLVIVGKIQDSYHLRIFDADKRQIIDVGKDNFLLDESLCKLLATSFNRSIDQTIRENLLKQLAFPNEGKGVVVIGKDKDSYHIRIFDWTGKRIVDKANENFNSDEPLRRQLKDISDRQSNNQSIDDATKSKLLHQIQKSLGLTPELQWLPSTYIRYELIWESSSAFPTQGKGLVIVGKDKDKDSYHIRIFDWTGKQIVDKADENFNSDEPLRRQLKDISDRQSNNQSIDDTTKSNLLHQIQKNLGLTLIGGKADAGRALIRIFGRMAMMVTDRLNRIPEKHFLAFLNLIGATQQPPRPARVPLTAYLVDNSPVDAIIPAGTQIAALPQGDETEDVLFETEQDLVVVRSQLQSAIVREGQQYCDHILTATTASGNFPVFKIEQPNTIYIAADQLTTKIDSQQIQLAIDNAQSLTDKWKWSYWDGETWQVLTSTPETNRLSLKATAPTQGWKPPKLKTIEGIEAQWLRGIAPATLPSLAEIHLVRAETGEISPDQSFFNTEEIDLSKDFLPFGEMPQFNDTFYIASQYLLNLAGSEVTLHFEPSAGIAPKPSSNPVPSIIWETWNGKTWEPVLKTEGANEAFYTSDWNREPKKFKLPNKVASVEVNGTTNYWLRARLVAGNYGGESQLEPMEYTLYTYTTTLPEKGRGTVNVLKTGNSYQVNIFDWNGNKTENTTPGSALSEKLSAAFPSNNQPINANIQSELIKQIQTSLNHKPEPIFRFASDSKSGYFPPCIKSIKLSRSDSNFNPSKTLKSFATGAFLYSDTDTFSVPTDNGLYLCFDLSFPNQAIALYLQVAQPKPGELQKSTLPETPAKLQWEYGVAEGWRSLSNEDGTKNLSQRGMVQFIGPADFAARSLFGRSGYWLRVRLMEGSFQIQPRLQRVLTNTVWAVQAATHQDEVLGSGTGDPNLVLHTLHTPVLPGQQLLVREPELPSPEEQAEIEKLEGKDAIALSTDASGQPQDIWVCWHEVSDFYASGSRDRHYTLNRMTGEIRFGGEGQGMPPPIGRNNIQMARYQSGGGSHGNRAAETLTDLKTTVPYVDRVTNHEPANGGADLESIAAVQESGSKQLRHGDRAVTWQDIEDLTYAASSEVARVKVLTPKFNPTDPLRTWINASEAKTASAQALPGLSDALQQAGQVTVLIVPNSPLQQPSPSLALVEQVKHYLGERISPTLTLHVTDPPWVQVTITATIVPISLETANGLAANVNAALTAFLHPLTGGTQKRGWPFGRHPHNSDIYALIERQPGVSHVTELLVSIKEEKEEDKSNPSIKDQFLIYSGEHEITIAHV